MVSYLRGSCLMNYIRMAAHPSRAGFSATASSLPTSLIFLSSSLFLRVASLYFFAVFLYTAYRYFWRPPREKIDSDMVRSPFIIANVFTPALVTLVNAVPAPTLAVTKTTTSFRAIYTVPAGEQNGQNLLPNIYDPQA